MYGDRRPPHGWGDAPGGRRRSRQRAAVMRPEVFGLHHERGHGPPGLEKTGMSAQRLQVACADWHCWRQCTVPVGCRPCCLAGIQTTAVVRGMYPPVRQVSHASSESGCLLRGRRVQPGVFGTGSSTGADRLVTDMHAVRETDRRYLHRARRPGETRRRGMAAWARTPRFRELRKRQPFLTANGSQQSGRRDLRPSP